jgi:hypothetical protein
MPNRLMTGAELDAAERHWKRVLLVFGATLMVDLAYLFTAFPAGTVKLACWLVAAASAGTCAWILRRLHKAGYRDGTGAAGSNADAYDLPDVVDALTDLADHD